MDDVERLFSEATRLFGAQEPAEAERLLRQAVVSAPHHVPSLSLLGVIAGRAGRDAQCVALLDQAVALSSGPQAAAGGREYRIWCDPTFGPYLGESLGAVVIDCGGRYTGVLE